ncbi:hypothetical protein NUW58_g10116 [Xylaria curta]|uniref:Uncharacterized protein n=1 Tax=Xylaria curta TaxID=42375 RepID=A0ACC1MRM5_9PEZI|nr:hypothetical protein NUW58_g10116 [Xylaria curta]
MAMNQNNSVTFGWAEPMDLDIPEQPSLTTPLNQQGDGLEGVVDATYPEAFRPDWYQATSTCSETDPTSEKFVSEPYEDIITSTDGEAIRAIRVGIQPQLPSKKVVFAPSLEAQAIMLRACRQVATHDWKLLQGALQLSQA